MAKREFLIREILINGRKIQKVIVDDHIYKHNDLTDAAILGLVRQLDGIEQLPDDVKPPYEYFMNFCMLAINNIDWFGCLKKIGST